MPVLSCRLIDATLPPLPEWREGVGVEELWEFCIILCCFIVLYDVFICLLLAALRHLFQNAGSLEQIVKSSFLESFAWIRRFHLFL